MQPSQQQQLKLSVCCCPNVVRVMSDWAVTATETHCTTNTFLTCKNRCSLFPLCGNGGGGGGKTAVKNGRRRMKNDCF
jgi:hypothetical protein